MQFVPSGMPYSAIATSRNFFMLPLLAGYEWSTTTTAFIAIEPSPLSDGRSAVYARGGVFQHGTSACRSRVQNSQTRPLTGGRVCFQAASIPTSTGIVDRYSAVLGSFVAVPAPRTRLRVVAASIFRPLCWLRALEPHGASC